MASSDTPTQWRIVINLKKWNYAAFRSAWITDNSIPIFQSSGGAKMRKIPQPGDTVVIHATAPGQPPRRLMRGTVVSDFEPAINITDPFNTCKEAPHRGTPLAAKLKITECLPLDTAPAVPWRGQRTWQKAVETD